MRKKQKRGGRKAGSEGGEGRKERRGFRPQGAGAESGDPDYPRGGSRDADLEGQGVLVPGTKGRGC